MVYLYSPESLAQDCSGRPDVTGVQDQLDNVQLGLLKPLGLGLPQPLAADVNADRLACESALESLADLAELVVLPKLPGAVSTGCEEVLQDVPHEIGVRQWALLIDPANKRQMAHVWAVDVLPSTEALCPAGKKL